MYTWAIIVVMVVVVVALIAREWHTRRREKAAINDWLTGVWVGDSTFCEEAQVGNMLLTIGPDDNGRWVYLVIAPDVTAQRARMTLGGGRHCGPLCEYAAHFDYEAPVDIPADVRLEMDRAAGRLRLWAADQMYGVFYKDLETTARSLGL